MKPKLYLLLKNPSVIPSVPGGWVDGWIKVEIWLSQSILAEAGRRAGQNFLLKMKLKGRP